MTSSSDQYRRYADQIAKAHHKKRVKRGADRYAKIVKELNEIVGQIPERRGSSDHYVRQLKRRLTGLA